jgi:hypothetical protein
MKLTIICLLAMLIACLSTCKKNSHPIVDLPEDPIDTIISPPLDSHIIGLGKVSMLKNGGVWDVPFKTGFSHSDSAFVISGSMNYSNGLRQLFSIDDVPCKIGKYLFEFWPSLASLYPNQIPQAAFVMTYDGDQGIGQYFLDTLRADHFVEVLRYDSLTNIVEGRFQVFLKKNETGGWVPSGISIPDSISMTEGKFRLEVKHF